MNNIFEQLQDRFKGASAVVLGCGPSLNDYDDQTILKEIDGKLLICIKQSYLKFPKHCHFHFINDNNMLNYRYGDKTNIITSSQAKKYPWWNLINKTPIYHSKVNTGNYSKTMAASSDFSRNELTNDFETYWGPGIILESVIPFIVHTGIKKLSFLGWDYADPKTAGLHMDHFYNHEDRQHFTNETIPIVSNEARDLIDSSADLYEYLLKSGISSEILTDKSFVSDKFPRRILNA